MTEKLDLQRKKVLESQILITKQSKLICKLQDVGEAPPMTVAHSQQLRNSFFLTWAIYATHFVPDVTVDNMDVSNSVIRSICWTFRLSGSLSKQIPVSLAWLKPRLWNVP